MQVVPNPGARSWAVPVHPPCTLAVETQKEHSHARSRRPSQHMKATVRLEHAFLAVEADHEVHAMLELSAPEVTSQQRPRWTSPSSSTAQARWPVTSSRSPGLCRLPGPPPEAHRPVRAHRLR